MASCANLSCTFLDQYPNYTIQINDWLMNPDKALFSPPLPPSPPLVVADPDIAGLGVILAFLISAYGTWVVVAIGYGCGYVNEALLGNLDKRLIRVKPRHSDRWGPLLVKMVLVLSDQQIMTGLSILAAGYAKRCTINVYHWQVVVYLAWMSSGTHLITLSVLRTYLREKYILRAVRVVGMLILFVMLCIAIVPTGSQTYYAIITGALPETSAPSYAANSTSVSSTSACGVPSACLWRLKYWNGWRWDSGLSLFLLVSSYTARAAALFQSSEAFFTQNIRDRLLGKFGKALDRKVQQIRDRGAHRQKASWAQLLSYRTYLATYAVTLAFLELYSSFLAPLLWVLLNLVWGSLQLLVPRTALAKQGQIAEENTFGFGQIIPLTLLALPLVAAFDAYYGQSDSNMGQPSDTKASTESQKPGNTHRPGPCSPKVDDSHTSDPLLMTKLPLMKTSSAGEMMRGQDADIATDVADAHLVRADTEQLLGDVDRLAERRSLGSLLARTPQSPGDRSPAESSETSKAFPAWRAYHQDFYASKWFRSIQIFILFCVISVAIVVYLLGTGSGDIFDTGSVILIWLPMISLPALTLLLLVLAGMRWSKVFQ